MYEESTPGSPSSRLGDAGLYFKTSLLAHESLARWQGMKAIVPLTAAAITVVAVM